MVQWMKLGMRVGELVSVSSGLLFITIGAPAAEQGRGAGAPVLAPESGQLGTQPRLCPLLWDGHGWSSPAGSGARGGGHARPGAGSVPREWLRVVLGEADRVLGGSHGREEHTAELAGVGAIAGARRQQWLFIPSCCVLPRHAGTCHLLWLQELGLGDSTHQMGPG